MIITGYHGTNSRFDKFDQTKARIPNDFYGGGVAYFTDNKDVAKTYANAMAKKKGGDRIIYEVRVHLNRIFDVDGRFTGLDLTQFLDRHNLEDFARGARLMGVGKDKYKIFTDLENGRLILTGEQVFRGLSNGMVNTAKARETLISLGFDGLRYNGGVAMDMAAKHNVYLVYDASNIKIVRRFSIKDKPTLSQVKHKLAVNK